ncbi:NOD3 protein [Pelomyxa schiedti]|nr:NOD3 protein [Pelomyxa schiedti]
MLFSQQPTTCTFSSFQVTKLDMQEHHAEVLRNNHTLLHIDLSLNALGSQGASIIFQSLHGNRSLLLLDVSRNDIGDVGAECAAECLLHNSTLRELRVSRNLIGPDGASRIAESLEVNHTLLKLNLSWNKIGEPGACSVSTALVKNATLLHLDISSNPLLQNGATSISSSLQRNSTVQSIRLTPCVQNSCVLYIDTETMAGISNIDTARSHSSQQQTKYLWSPSGFAPIIYHFGFLQGGKHSAPLLVVSGDSFPSSANIFLQGNELKTVNCGSFLIGRVPPEFPSSTSATERWRFNVEVLGKPGQAAINKTPYLQNKCITLMVVEWRRATGVMSRLPIGTLQLIGESNLAPPEM